MKGRASGTLVIVAIMVMVSLAWGHVVLAYEDRRWLPFFLGWPIAAIALTTLTRPRWTTRELCLVGMAATIIVVIMLCVRELNPSGFGAGGVIGEAAWLGAIVWLAIGAAIVLVARGASQSAVAGAVILGGAIGAVLGFVPAMLLACVVQIVTRAGCSAP